MKKNNYALIFLIILSFILLSYQICQAELLYIPKIYYSGPHNPSISRFISFGGQIPADTVGNIYADSIKIYINGKDMTSYLESKVDGKTGDLIFIYKPVKPLPIGKVNVKITSLFKTGQTAGHSFSFTVNPASNRYLAPYVRAARSSRAGYLAHLKLARAFEKAHILDDAYEEYKQAYSLNTKSIEARSGFFRTFMMRERKYIEIKKENITVVTTKDAGLDLLGSLMLFEVKIINNRLETIKFDPNEALLIADNYKIRPIKKFEDYIKSAFKDELIPQANYTRLRYILDLHPYTLFELKEKEKYIEIQPGESKTGYLAFGLKVPIYKNLKLRLAVLPKPKYHKYKLYFNLPFRRTTSKTTEIVDKSFIPKTVSNGIFAVTVTNWETGTKIKDCYSAKPGYKFVTVYLSLEDVSDDIQSIKISNFSLADNRKFYEPASLSYFPLVLLKHGDLKFGYLVFQIPEKSTPVKITLQKGGSEPISVDLL